MANWLAYNTAMKKAKAARRNPNGGLGRCDIFLLYIAEADE